MSPKTTPTQAFWYKHNELLKSAFEFYDKERCEECGYFYDDTHPCECDCEEDDD